MEDGTKQVELQIRERVLDKGLCSCTGFVEQDKATKLGCLREGCQSPTSPFTWPLHFVSLYVLAK